MYVKNGLKPEFTFTTFVEGEANRIARTAALKLLDEPGIGSNPLFICGDVGLGKTHLMQAIGNRYLVTKPEARVIYRHSERFVADMVRALQDDTLNEFQAFYRNLDALLLDDIQFFTDRARSQEELLHTFNTLVDNKCLMIMACDRYPAELSGIEAHLASRVGCGLTVTIELPDLETRVAILMSKARLANVELSEELACFVARRFHSNIRELEGALNRIMADAYFSGQTITLESARKSLRDLLILQDRLAHIKHSHDDLLIFKRIKIIDMFRG